MSAGSMTATLPLGSIDVNFAATAHPPAPPPTTTSLKLIEEIFLKIFVLKINYFTIYL